MILEAIEIAVGFFGLLSTWRFVAVLAGAVVVFFGLVSFVPIGLPRVAAFVVTIVIGGWFGAAWQRRHERSNKKGANA